MHPNIVSMIQTYTKDMFEVAGTFSMLIPTKSIALAVNILICLGLCSFTYIGFSQGYLASTSFAIRTHDFQFVLCSLIVMYTLYLLNDM